MNRLVTLLSVVVLSLAAYADNIYIGYKTAPFNPHKYKISHTKTTLPAKYDSREFGYITESRNQQIDGTCWAFATCDVLEALSNKLGFNDGYYSPQLLSNCHDGFVWEKQKGGNATIATAMLSRLEGPAYEESIPYDIDDEECMEHTAKDYPAYFLDAYNLPEYDNTAIKECIYEYGSVTAAMHMDLNYYNSSTNTYCYTGTKAPNHAISLIGWDDEKGAYISKFNYGSKHYDNGCMYISYNDAFIASECTAYPKRVEKSLIDTTYMYDKTGMTGYFDFAEYANTVSVMSFFDGVAGDTLNVVGAFTWEPNTTLKFYVMVGSDVYTKELYCKYSGFHTTTLDDEIVLDGQYIVAVDYPTTVVPIEISNSEFNTPTFYPAGRQFFQLDGEEPTISIGTNTPYNNFNFCIRAYAKHHVDSPIPTTTQDDSESSINVVIGGKINPEIWETATSVDIYTLDGSLKEHLLSENDVNLKGLYIFAVSTESGTKRSVELLY